MRTDRCIPYRSNPTGYKLALQELGMAILPDQVVRTVCKTACLHLDHVRVGTIIRPRYARDQCVYCGEPGYTKDHLWPRGWGGIASRSVVPTVPACGQCNGMLNDSFAPIVPERRGIVHERIRRKYRRLLESPEHDLAEYGHALRAVINRGIILKERVTARLEWPNHDHEYDIRAYEAAGLILPVAIHPMT